jgi:tRNA (mo5U34)-methyltransferase
MNLPAFRAHKQRVDALHEDRDRLAQEVEALKEHIKARGLPPLTAGQADWSETKRYKQKLSREIRSKAATSTLGLHINPVEGHLDRRVIEWVRQQMEAEPYWFQRIEVLPGIFSPGWGDPVVEKLPYFGLPEDLTNKRVLDIGCAEGFFSFEAERRGAREVIGIDSFPDSVRRFNITKAARQSNATAFLMNVYDLEPKRLGTFDVVLFYGVFYHLKHPQYALERIRSVCTGDILFQTHICEEPALKGTPWARFYPHGMMSGANHESWDPTIFWLFNSVCCLAMLDHVGFTDLRIISDDPKPFVVSGRSPEQAPGVPPDQTEAPWC